MTAEAGPDKGWSWVVAFAACFNSLVLAGIFRTSGVLFVAFIATFEVSREEAAWPMGVCIAVLNFTGPVSGVLSQRYGIRPVVMIGAVIGAIGISACYFTTSILIITILFGGVFGIGYGLVSTLMPAIVNAYFLDLRSTANGIASSGSCFGSVILPLLFEFLISEYGLSGCFLLTGGIVLNVAVAGALMKPPSWNISHHQNTTEAEVSLPFATENNKPTQWPNRQSPSPLRSISKDFQKSRNSTETLNEIDVPTSSNNGNYRDDWEFSNPNTSPLKNHRAEIVSTLSKRSTLQAIAFDLSEDLYYSVDTHVSLISERNDSISMSIEPNQTPKELQQSLFLAISSGKGRPADSLKTFAVVLSSPMFYLTAFNNVTFFFLYHMYVNVIIDYSLDQGVEDEDAKYILFAFALSDLFGRLCLGWVTDRKFVSRTRFIMSGMIGIGIVFFSFPFATEYWSLTVVSCFYGVLLGSTMIIFPILLVDLLGIEQHAIAYGCMCFMNGFTSLIGPLVIGYFRDKLCHYYNMFFILGIVSVVASLSWILERCFWPNNHAIAIYQPIDD